MLRLPIGLGMIGGAHQQFCVSQLEQLLPQGTGKNPISIRDESLCDGENNGCIPPTLEGWVYIIPIHGPLDGPLYTWAQYTPTKIFMQCQKKLKFAKFLPSEILWMA